ncbi:MAG TPA: adenosylhomocysteinase, partial [Candidatus Acidoferrales bacterium]|nr:adenosylhomocysteinase [Candidatus Acidoferrales bacterium]
MTTHDVTDMGLAAEGLRRISWAEREMPVLRIIRARFEQERPLAGLRIGACLHVTTETANLMRTLAAGGADVTLGASNPLSTQDDVAAALAAEGTSIYAWHGLSTEEFYWCIDKTLEMKPTLTLDDGADLIFRVHDRYKDLAKDVIGGTEETTTGVHRLRAMGKAGKLLYPVIAVNDSETKWDFDNVYGTGQSSLDGILRASSVLVAGKTFVVAGYGHCGRGVAIRARGLGANVIVTEIKPTAALKATLDGFRVMKMDDAAKLG